MHKHISNWHATKANSTQTVCLRTKSRTLMIFQSIKPAKWPIWSTWPRLSWLYTRYTNKGIRERNRNPSFEFSLSGTVFRDNGKRHTYSPTMKLWSGLTAESWCWGKLTKWVWTILSDGLRQAVCSPSKQIIQVILIILCRFVNLFQWSYYLKVSTGL